MELVDVWLLAKSDEASLLRLVYSFSAELFFVLFEGWVVLGPEVKGLELTVGSFD